jgi:hypothetical protein
MPGIDKVLGQQPAAAPQLHHEPASRTDRLKQLEDPGSAAIRMEAEPEMVR